MQESDRRSTHPFQNAKLTLFKCLPKCPSQCLIPQNIQHLRRLPHAVIHQGVSIHALKVCGRMLRVESQLLMNGECDRSGVLLKYLFVNAIGFINLCASCLNNFTRRKVIFVHPREFCTTILVVFYTVRHAKVNDSHWHQTTTMLR
jgi:hypothetical protein